LKHLQNLLTLVVIIMHQKKNCTITINYFLNSDAHQGVEVKLQNGSK
jgi:hypothetical protein